MLYYSLWLPVALSTMFILRKLDFDKYSLLIIGAAIALYYFHFYHSARDAFSMDQKSHAQYIEYVVNHHELPARRDSEAARHPPAYYILAAGLYRLAQYTDSRNPLDTVRHLSMALYLGFIVFSALSLRRLFPAASHVYYVALGLMAFWPVGVTMGARITCDLLLYPAEMGAIYFFICWLQDHRINALTGAFTCAGVSLLAKNSGILFLAFSGLLLVHACWRNRRRLTALITPSLPGAIGFSLSCAYLTFISDPPEYAIIPSQPLSGFSEFLHVLVFFDPVLFLNETIISQHQGESAIRFWNWFFRSLILGDFVTWNALFAVFAFGCVWLAMFYYMLYGLCAPKKLTAQEKIILCFLAFVAATMVGMLMYMRYRMPDFPHVADARYIYPIVTLTVICFAKTMQWHLDAGRMVAFRVGNGLALGFILLTLVLFICQDMVLEKTCCFERTPLAENFVTKIQHYLLFI